MAKNNEGLIRELVREGFLKSPLLTGAFRKIDRKDFVPREHRDEAYGNYPLPIGGGQTISQPLTVAFMLELLCGSPDARGRGPDQCVGKKILDVGTGSGWVAALLAYLVGEGGRVISIERIRELVGAARSNLAKYDFVERGILKLIVGDGALGYRAAAPYDKIIAAAAGDKIPDAWKKQLKVGGRIVAPVGQSIVVLDKIEEDQFRTQEHFGFSFVPLIRD